MEVDASLYNGHGAHVLVVLGGGVVGDNDRDMGHIFSFTQLITMFHTFISSIISSRFLFYFSSHISRFLFSTEIVEKS